MFAAAMSVVYPPLFSQTVIALPNEVPGVERCRIDLCGGWEFSLEPGQKFWKNSGSEGEWKPIQVPEECRMQGFPIEHDVEYAYRKQVYIPEDFLNKRILVRFNGVYSYTRVWVNGRFVRDHHGGFTA
jgi:beta-galactosidase/beta-glucuronidase